MNKNKKYELSDDELDQVVGGVSGGLFIQTDAVTFSKCGKKFSSSSERERHEKTCSG